MADKRSILIDFLKDHPAITIVGFAEECGISHSLLKFIISGDRNLTDSSWSKILPIMWKYGYEEAH